MKTKRSKFLQKTLMLTAAVAASQSVQAGFQYQPRSLVVGLRQSGGSSELVVNAGAISNLTSLASGSSITITSLTTDQLNSAFADLNDVSWSAAADVRLIDDPTYAYNTIWVTRPRSVFGSQTAPWIRKGETTLGNAAAKMDGIAGGAVNYGTTIANGADNTSTGIIIPAGLQPYAYSYFIGANGNYLSAFQGNVETATPSDFSTAGQPVRADFYELQPGTGSGTYLGYFEFSPSGVLTYTAGPSSVVIPPPNIVSIDRTGNVNTITFSTVTGGNYTLRYSDDLTAPLANWTAVGSSTPGDGTNKSLTDTTTNTQRFYIISAQ
jgi:hypothetical protein